LLDKSFKCFEAFLENAISAARPVLALNLHELESGVVLVSDIKTTDGVLLIAAGNHLTDVMIKRLLNNSASDRVKEPIYVQ
jgi:hypothetical protein